MTSFEYHDFTGPLIDKHIPPQDLALEKPGPARFAQLIEAVGEWAKRNRTRTIATSCFIACVGLGGLIASVQRPIHRLSSELLDVSQSSLTGLFEYGPSYTLTRPDKLPRTFYSWTTAQYLSEFDIFIDRYRRPYFQGSREFSSRFEIFRSNLERIHQHNHARKDSYKLALNQFADMSPEEWASMYLTAREETTSKEERLWHLIHVANSTLPREVNWQERGCVTPVKNQLKCGSCWAFSASGAIEGALCAHTGKLLNLSEQQMIDCSGPDGTHGCHGGSMNNAFRYVIESGGLCAEDEYPYHAKEGTCHQCDRIGKIVKLGSIPARDDKAVRAALAFHGPVAAGIEADRAAFQFYHKGVLDLPCGRRLNHAILIVGYGHFPENNESYWYVKNSWGPTWGDRGYIKLGRKHHGSKGECGVLLTPTIPLVEGENNYPRDAFLGGHDEYMLQEELG